MNIKEAKETIQYTLQAYFQKDESGYPLVPLRQQRPILLIGPPGIGKTAIMEQIAGECGAGLVAYTMTIIQDRAPWDFRRSWSVHLMMHRSA